MKTLLRIDASARTHGSATRAIADHFLARWQEHEPDGTVVRRDLALEPIPHLSNATIEAFHRPAAEGPELRLSNRLVRELMGADHLLIASPLYNLTLPSPLKAYFDHVVRSGLTFEAGPEGYRGLLRGKSATLIVARGGPGRPGDSGDFQTDYLKAILAFIGIESVDVIGMGRTAFGEPTRTMALDRARLEIDQLFEPPSPPRLEGAFEEGDLEEIGAARRAQAEAIVAGDAEAYAALCTDDIRLMIPGRDVIAGRDAFLEAERSLFARAAFSRFEKEPLSVERAGDLVVEIGRQRATTDLRTDTAGVYSAEQKYTHILRRTPDGWRFAVLMSNPSE